MVKGYRSTLKCMAWLILCTTCALAHADWQPTLVASEQVGYLRADDTIRLKIPADVPVEELQKLVLELDAIDVTAMVQREGAFALYTPVQPLTPGTHTLRVVEYADDGSIMELGFWSFEVRQSALFREYAVAADSQLTGSYRVADNNLIAPEPNRLNGQGSSQVAYSAASGDWYSNGNFDLLYNSSNGMQSNGRSLDNGEFLFSAGNKNADVRIGHQTVGASSLVMDNFRRRGVSVEGRVPTINSRLTGFLLSSEAINGFQHGLAIGDAEKRVDGVTFESSPLKSRPQALYLSGTWLDGEGSDSSGAVASVAGAEFGQSKGRAWSLSADSQLFNDRLRLRAEYAGTDYDFSTTDTLASQNDTAYSLLATFSDSTASGMNWNVGVENREIGTFFKSLANQSLPSDRRLLRAFGGSQWTTMGFQASFEQQQDNVNDIKELPRVKTNLGSISLNWSPVASVGWLGSPSLSAAYSRQQQNQVFTPIGFLLADTDNKLDSLQANAMFAYSLGSWGLSLMNSQFRDNAGVQADTDTNSLSFDSSLLLMQQRLNLLPSVRYDRTDDISNQQNSIAVTYGLQSAYVIKPEKLDGSLNISLNRNQTTDDTLNNDVFSVSMAMNWHLLAASRNRSGFDVSASGMYNNLSDNVMASNSIDTYQVFLTLTMVLPSRAGQAQ